MPSNWRGVRLLWDETGFELVGAFCVAAVALGFSWLVLESLFGLNGLAAGAMAVAAACVTLEGASRRHYAGRRPAVPRRPVVHAAAEPQERRARDADRSSDAPRERGQRRTAARRAGGYDQQHSPGAGDFRGDQPAAPRVGDRSRRSLSRGGMTNAARRTANGRSPASRRAA